MIEYFDVVDKNDIPTGEQITKADAHKNGRLHRCITIFVFDPGGRLYIQPHLKGKGLLDHSVGGHVSAGESYAVAAKREGEEELGLFSQTLEEISLGTYSNEDYPGVETEFHLRLQHMFGLYECHPSDEWKFEPNDEVKSIFPETLESIVAQMNATPGRFTPGFLNTMAQFIEVKALPYVLDVESCRSRWIETRV